jgi:hypothetical protein
MTNIIREPIQGITRCVICMSANVNTGSEFEFFCAALNEWICETHCTEVQMPDYADTRDHLAELIHWKGDPKALIEICARCEGVQTRR